MSGKLTVTLISERKRRSEHLGNLLFLLLGYIREFRRCKASDWEEDELDGRRETVRILLCLWLWKLIKPITDLPQGLKISICVRQILDDTFLYDERFACSPSLHVQCFSLTLRRNLAATYFLYVHLYISISTSPPK